jgi:sugar-specific transcriptional regulator TrmB
VTDKSFKNALQTLGLSEYEVEAYVNILRTGPGSAVDVAKRSSVPKSRIYDVLRKLESKGYVETYEQDSLHVRALDPSETANELQQRATSLTDAADRVEEMWDEPGIEDARITLVERPDTVYDQATRYIKNATNEIQIASAPNQFEELRSELVNAIDRDVIIQLTLHPPTEGATINPAEFDLEGAVTEARHRVLAAPFVVIVDREQMVFLPQESTMEGSYGLIANNYPMAHVFHRYFQTTLWDWWDTVYMARGDEPPITYINLRAGIADIEPIIADGATVQVTVQGIDTISRESVTVSGSIDDIICTRWRDDIESPSPLDIAGQVAIVISNDEGEYTIGGWYARIEDIEMRRLTIDAINW